MAENKYEGDKDFDFGSDLIEDSLDFCADIYKYYEPEKADKIKSYSPAISKNNSDEKTKSEKVSRKEDKTEEVGIKLYTKLVAMMLLAMLFVRLLNAYIIQETIVSGSSMSPTLENSDRLLIDKIVYKASELNRFDIVVFNYHDASLYIKRIIGVPGDKVIIKDGMVYINGELLSDDPMIQDIMYYSGIAENEVILGEDEYFVLGDNRNNSYDSRYDQVGIVNKNKIIGRVLIRIFPITKFGSVN